MPPKMRFLIGLQSLATKVQNSDMIQSNWIYNIDEFSWMKMMQKYKYICHLSFINFE